MGKLFLFMMVSLDGYVEGEHHDLSWHHVDAEFNEFAAKQLDEVDTLIFGRRTYQLMESFWPTKQGLEEEPLIAAKMNKTSKVVFSHSLKSVVETEQWRNVRLVKDTVALEIQKMKNEAKKSIVVLGSNNLCVTLVENNLLDELRIMVNPVVIGKGTPLFAGIRTPHSFHLESSRNFANGNVLLTYHVGKDTSA